MMTSPAAMEARPAGGTTGSRFQRLEALMASFNLPFLPAFK